ncbi:hypothetical protein [Winogradskyella sp. PE311]|uniref:hypothetical protein n=1 Tax=Winogradskyella sp. PE311 TaxID=3366943 RepID=UPI003980D19E
MKSLRLTTLFLLGLLLLSTQCDEDNVPISPLCDEVPIIDSSFYENSESDTFSILNAEVDGDCLLINLSASGCDGSSWQIELVDADIVQESSPVQRSLKLVLTNNEACLAVFTQRRSFDLRELRVAGEIEVLLNIQDFSEPILYSY